MAPGLSDPGTWSLQPGRHPGSGKKKREMGLRAEDASGFSKKQPAVGGCCPTPARSQSRSPSLLPSRREAAVVVWQ